MITALALRESGVFASVDVYEQTKVPTTAGAGLNIPPNGARISRWLGVDLDGGDPRGPDGAIDGGRAAILESTRQFNADGSTTKRPFDHVTAAGDGAGFHHMHRLDLLMCLYKRVFEFGPDSGAPCPITSTAPARRSCTSSGDIAYSWRLILMPPGVREATVAHEVAHRLHMHHGPEFHDAVKRLLGRDPKTERAWLKAHGSAMQRVGR